MLDPIHKILAGSTVEVFNPSPGKRFSAVTSPFGVNIKEPRSNAENAESNYGIESALSYATCIFDLHARLLFQCFVSPD